MSYSKVDEPDNDFLGIEATLQVLTKCIVRKYQKCKQYGDKLDHNLKELNLESCDLYPI